MLFSLGQTNHIFKVIRETNFVLTGEALRKPTFGYMRSNESSEKQNWFLAIRRVYSWNQIAATSFKDILELATADAIMENEGAIVAWFNKAKVGDKPRRFESSFKFNVGFGIDKFGNILFSKKVTVVLVKDAGGLKILTSYPIF